MPTPSRRRLPAAPLPFARTAGLAVLLGCLVLTGCHGGSGDSQAAEKDKPQVPTASSGSVTSRTDFGSPDISAMPPALSVIGP